MFWSLSVFAGTADWMGEMYSTHPQTRLLDITIPGSHESGTYRISWVSDLEPGTTRSYRFFKPVVAGWAKTQYLNIYQQLVHGIRFLDLRIAFDGKQKAVVAHGLVSVSLKTILNDVQKFSMEHPKEVILLRYCISSDYQASITEAELSKAQDQATQIMNSHFQGRILEFSHDRTLEEFWNQNRSIMFLTEDYERFWPNVVSLHEAQTYLDDKISSNSGTRLSDTQLIYTPPNSLPFFFKNTYLATPFARENSLSKFSSSLRNRSLHMLRNWHSKGYPLNIVSTDFIESFNFVETLLEFNRDKLSR